MKFSIGDKVCAASMAKLGEGEVIETMEPLMMNGAKIIGEKFRVKWDEEKLGESGWLSEFELVLADHKKESK